MLGTYTSIYCTSCFIFASISYLWKVLLFSCLATPGVLCSSEQKVTSLTDYLLYFIHFQQAISTYFIRALCYRFQSEVLADIQVPPPKILTFYFIFSFNDKGIQIFFIHSFHKFLEFHQDRSKLGLSSVRQIRILRG